MIEINESGDDLTDADIASLEQDLGCVLPQEYREFLVAHNGGRPSPDGFDLAPDLGKRVTENAVHFFYGLGPTAPHAELRLVHHRFKGRIPSELFCVGEDHFGNQVCVCLDGDQRGYVFVWDHEREHAPPSYANVVLLAQGFSSFLGGLHQRQRCEEFPIGAAIHNDDVTALAVLLVNTTDLETTDEWGRTMLENAAIENAVHVFEWLYLRGAQLRNALSLAEDNLRFFPDHERMVRLIRRLSTEH